jgi:hypothetical protein
LQAFDKYGAPSTIKSYEIKIARSNPTYVAGTIGRSLEGPASSFRDPVTGGVSTVSTGLFETHENWLRDSRNYAAYVNCPLEVLVRMLVVHT